jgi:hypothetical protein
MSSSFAEIVEEIKALSTQEKQELHELIEKYLIEERREEIYQSYICSISELEVGKAEFSSDTDKLKGLLLND